MYKLIFMFYHLTIIKILIIKKIYIIRTGQTLDIETQQLTLLGRREYWLKVKTRPKLSLWLGRGILVAGSLFNFLPRLDRRS